MIVRKGSSSKNDDLAGCILVLAKMHGISATREALVSALPLSNGALAPSVFSRAASRLGFVSRVVCSRL
jgi:ATP-binding cassette subfamily C protein LapB